MSGVEELLIDKEKDSKTLIGDVQIDEDLNVVINPVDGTDKNLCHLSDLPERDVDDDTLQTLKTELDELNCREFLPNSEQHPDDSSDLSLAENPVDLYRLTVDDKDRLVLSLSNHTIPLYELTSSDGELDCPELRDCVEDDEELYRMIEYTRESETESYFYVTEDFDTVAVETGYTEILTSFEKMSLKELFLLVAMLMNLYFSSVSVLFILLFTMFSFLQSLTLSLIIGFILMLNLDIERYKTVPVYEAFDLKD